MERHNQIMACHNEDKVRALSLRGFKGGWSWKCPFEEGEWFECELGGSGRNSSELWRWKGYVQRSMSWCEPWEGHSKLPHCRIQKGPWMRIKFECPTLRACRECIAWLKVECLLLRLLSELSCGEKIVCFIARSYDISILFEGVLLLRDVLS